VKASFDELSRSQQQLLSKLRKLAIGAAGSFVLVGAISILLLSLSKCR